MKDLKEQIDRPRKIALYLYMGTSNPWITVNEVRYVDRDEHWNKLPDGELREETSADMARISEPAEIKFKAVDSDAQVQNAVAALDAAERAVIAELNQKIAEIRGRKAQLLALTHQLEPVEG